MFSDEHHDNLGHYDGFCCIPVTVKISRDHIILASL
jgi:hypothetical protein